VSNFPLQANPDMAKPFRHTRQSLLIMLFVTTLGLFGCSNHADIDGPVYEEYAPQGFELVAVAMPFDRPSDVRYGQIQKAA